MHETRAQRVRFGSGAAPAAVAEEVGRLGARRVMVIASPAARAVADRITAGLPVVLPHVLALNAPYAPEAERRIARAFGGGGAVAGLQTLRRAVGAPKALREIGLARSDLPAAAGLILPVVPPDNPAPVSRAVLERLLTAAWNGADPA